MADLDDELDQELEYLHAKPLNEEQDMEIGMDPSEMDVSGTIEMPEEDMSRGPTIEMPDEQMAPAPAPSPTNVSASWKGMTQRGLATGTGLRNDADARAAAATAPMVDQANSEILASRETTSMRAKAMADEALGTQKFYDEQGKIFERIQDLHQTTADLWQQSYAESKQVSARYVEGYRQQLAAASALMAQDP